MRLDTGVAEVTETGVQLANGEQVDADVVVTGIGVRPARRLAVRFGDRTGHRGGLDEHLRTSLPGIYALGDVAVRWSPRWNTRSGSSTGTTREKQPALSLAFCSTTRPARTRCLSTIRCPTSGVTSSVTRSSTWDTTARRTRWSSGATAPRSGPQPGWMPRGASPRT